MPTYDEIHLLLGKDYRDQPLVRRSLEIANSEWKQRHMTHLDHSSAHKEYLVKRAAAFLTNEDTAGAIARDVGARGYDHGRVAEATYAEVVRERNAGMQRVEHPDGSCTITLAPEPTSIPVITAARHEPVREGYGNPDDWPFAREKREMAERKPQVIASKMQPGSFLPPGRMLGERTDPGWKPEPGKVGNPASFPGKLDRQLIR